MAESARSSTASRASSTRLPSGRPVTGLVSEACLARLQRVAHAQAQLLDVEWLGDVIVGVQFQPVQPVAALALFGQEDDRDVLGFAVGAQPAGHLEPVDIRQANIQDDQVRVARLGGAHAVFPPIDGQHLIPLHAEIRVQHIRDIQVILNDQQGWLCFVHELTLCAQHSGKRCRLRTAAAGWAQDAGSL